MSVRATSHSLNKSLRIVFYFFLNFIFVHKKNCNFSNILTTGIFIGIRIRTGLIIDPEPNVKNYWILESGLPWFTSHWCFHLSMLNPMTNYIHLSLFRWEVPALFHLQQEIRTTQNLRTVQAKISLRQRGKLVLLMK